MSNARIITQVYVLAKNEQANIERCLRSLEAASMPVTVLDSGSDDQTISIAESFPNVSVESFEYSNHCDSYNAILARHTSDEYVMILDADIRFSPELVDEIGTDLRNNGNIDSMIAPVTMYWAGQRLKHCSLYPPKPIVFRGGADRFVSMGHGETLVSGTRTRILTNRIIHDDRKPVDQFIQSQIRYANNLVVRSKVGGLNWKDRIRMKWPIFVFVTPVYAYIFRMGFLDGRAGLIYAIDRLIFESLGYRATLIDKADGEEDDG